MVHSDAPTVADASGVGDGTPGGDPSATGGVPHPIGETMRRVQAELEAGAVRSFEALLARLPDASRSGGGLGTRESSRA